MNYLLDTNVISEIRDGKQTDPNVSAWWSSIPVQEVYLSVLTLGEILRGIEQLRKRDPFSAKHLLTWFKVLTEVFSARLLPVDLETAKQWAVYNANRRYPVIDSLLAATAKTQNMILVTRNTRDMEGLGVKVLNPFKSAN